MNFIETPLRGAYVIDIEPRSDTRGLFARVFCHKEFAERGLDSNVEQCNTSFNPVKGTLRGMHYQLPPHQEVKLVRCTRGAIYDVIVDLRPNSPTYLKWFGVEMTADNHRMIYVPRGFAHGYLTLTADAEVFYQVSESYHPESERGLRYNDPAVAIKWPIEPAVISDKDRTYATLAY